MPNWFLVMSPFSVLKKRKQNATASAFEDSDDEEKEAAAFSPKKTKLAHMPTCKGTAEKVREGDVPCICGRFHNTHRNKGKVTNFCCACCAGSRGGAPKKIK
jgi:hypothetical protein